MSIPDVSERSIAELVSLEGRSAVVTGGAMGLGYGIARRLAQAGAAVVIGDVADTEGPAARLSQECGARVDGTHLDVSDPASIAACAQLADDTFGRLDIWVNNAGIYPTVPLLDMRTEDWDRVLDVNLRGSFIGAREAALRMVPAGQGVIINLASTAGFHAIGPGVAHYVSSKHGVIGLTKSLAVELGPSGIRVLGIAPTMIDTPGTEAGAEQARQAGLGDLLDTFAQRLPLRRVGVIDDVARVALFCASDLALFMTGSTLLADAGEIAV